MALRNIFRHKRRTVITTLTIAVGVMVFLWADGIYRGMHRQMAENVIYYLHGSIMLMQRAYAEEEKSLPLRYFFEDESVLETELLQFQEITGGTGRIPFVGEILAQGRNLHVLGYVVDVPQDTLVFRLSQALVKGDFFQGKSDELLIGADLARTLELNVGDELILAVQTKYGTYNALTVRVAGIFRTTHPQVDEGAVFVSRETARALLDIGEKEFITYHIGVHWPKGESVEHYTQRVERIAQKLSQRFPEYVVVSFAKRYAEVFTLMKTDESFMYIMLLVIFLIASVGIVNTILMAVHERMKEIGIMRAMGFSSFQIRWLFVMEGMWLGVVGGAAGLFFGFLLNLYQVYWGYDMEAWGLTSGSDFGLPIWGTIYGDWNPPAFAMAFVFSVIMAAFAAFIPSRYATRITVTECLRFL
ncbi:ABC transporter permease [Thermospira aquatica]|uniref:ABC transporter permease n=1 Tax=Thermospira aquatica TaxID=2828656 RepID=A0AAX3BCG6_9SPIR|nr:FtsX-like permease family protein [Thermospira aquatica]URA09889.1 ABC transporter permease [Thermospira aquatica]